MKKFVTLAFAVAIAASAISAAPAKHKAVRMAGRTERAGKSARLSQAKKFNGVTKEMLAAAPVLRADDYDWQPLWTDVLSFIRQGSVAAPVEVEYDDDWNIPAEIIGEANYGFGGGLLYEAGEGVMLLKYSDESGEEGMLWSPDVTPGDILYVEFDVRMAEEGITGYEVDLVAAGYSGAYDYFICDEVSSQWQTLRYVIDTTEYDADDDGLYLQWWPYAEREGDEHDILIRNLNIEYVPAAPVEPLGTVSDLTMALNADGNIGLRWSAVENANYYVAEVGRVHPVASGSDFAIADADFSGMASDGTLDSPIEDNSLTTQIEQLPGALFVLPTYINGAIGVQDRYFYNYFMDYAACIESGEYDLTAAKDGEVRFSIDVCSGTGAYLSALLYTWDDAAGTWTVADRFVKTGIGADFQTVDFSLSGGGERSFFMIMPAGDENYDYEGNLFFRSIKAEITLADDAEEVTLPVMSWEGETTGFTVESPVAGDTYFAYVTAYRINESYEIKQQGSPSDKEYFAVPTQGIGDAVSDVDADAPAVYYNLQGVKVAAPDRGLYIEVRGDKAVKVVR